MKRNEIWQAIELELREAKKFHPHWPDHVCAQAGNVINESGKLMSVCLDWKYEKSDKKEMQEMQLLNIKNAAIASAVAAIRFLENLKETI